MSDRLMYPNKLTDLIKTFFIIGCTSFGGYMSLIAMVRKSLVDRKKIISDEMLVEAISLSSLLPGPVAVNVVAYVGYKLSGLKGALLSILAVLIPSFLLVYGCSVLYFEFAEEYTFDGILYGVVPGVIGIIISVGISIAKKTCIKLIHYFIAFGSFIILFLYSGYGSVVAVLLGAGIVGIGIDYKTSFSGTQQNIKFSSSLVWLGISFALILAILKFFFPQDILAKLFIEFSGVSLTLFGGGYVMVPILKTILVDQLAWFTYKEFVFGISIGQVTPGPILISSVFFGYKMAGLLGAIISSIAIFLPSSILMILASGVYQKIKQIWVVQAALGGIKPAVVGLIFYSGASLFIKHLESYEIWLSLCMLLTSFIAIHKLNIQTPIIVLVSGLVGYGVYYFNS